MEFIEQLARLVPRSPEDQIDWEQIGSLLSGTPFPEMKNTLQNPVYHGEGDVYAHTRMVTGKLTADPAFYGLDPLRKTGLFLAAVLHDIGKVRTTRMENGSWTSPHHASTGSLIVREFLWKNCGLCGTPEAVSFRETVCSLVANHMQPVYLIAKKDPERKLRTIAAAGEPARDFSWELLCMLSEADVTGRVAADTEESLTKVRLAGVMAEEAGCLKGPYEFPDPIVKRAYLGGRNVLPDQPLYDDTWGEVILMSGLPGTGKDTWIRQHAPSLPVVSLDEIRELRGIKADGKPGALFQAAQEQAREYLRRKQPFVWNATNLYREVRQGLISLFERYGARSRIVWLETDLQTRRERNAGRPDAVPEKNVEKMLSHMVPPLPDEAHTVTWLCV